MIECGQGKAVTYQVQVRGGPPDRAPLVGVFDGTEALTGIIWPAGATPASRLAASPACTWADGPNGLVDYALTTATSSTIPPGAYKTSVAATVGSDSIDLIETDLIIYAVGLVAAAPAATAVSGATATTLGLVSTLYCTDEHVAVRCGPDFSALCPDSQMLASGADGIFDASDPWTLASVSNDFEAQGVAVGNVAWLRKPAAAFPAGGQLLAVSAVDGTSLTLRRLGMGGNVGRAPAPAAGLTGVEFQVATFNPQIENAVYELNQRYSIDAAIGGRAPTDVYDLRVFRDACVAMVLLDRYSDESRTNSGDYAAKVAALQERLGELRAALQIRWAPIADGLDRRTNWFSTRIVR